MVLRAPSVTRGARELGRELPGFSRGSREEVLLEGGGGDLEAPGQHGHGGVCGGPLPRVRIGKDERKLGFGEEREEDQQGAHGGLILGVAGCLPELVDECSELVVPFPQPDMLRTGQEEPPGKAGRRPISAKYRSSFRCATARAGPRLNITPITRPRILASMRRSRWSRSIAVT